MLPNNIAVDLDDTLFINAFPLVGDPVRDKKGVTTIDKVKKLQREGWYLILWTCRNGESLQTAVTACKKHGLIFDAVNANHPDSYKHFGLKCNDESRKIFAHYYLDDRAINIEHFLP